MEQIIDIFLNFSSQIGYAGIVILMTIESSFIPFPSEVVIPPAAYLAAQGEMNIFLVILSGIIGSLLGAIINYFLAFTLGRKVIYTIASHRFCKIIYINEKKIKKAEDYFLKYGNISTLLGRLVPAVRQLISIPAGFSRMKFRNFLLFTLLGSGTWTVILAILGYFFGANQESLARYYKEITLAVIIIVLVVIIGIVIKKKMKKIKQD